MSEKNSKTDIAHMHYRESEVTDIPAMAVIRSAEWGDYDYWMQRITAYYNKEFHPQQALKPRIFYVAYKGDQMVGFIAGHLTKRLGCEGELEWINVMPAYRNKGIAGVLVKLLAAWFEGQNASRICVDPGNEIARLFYKKQKAENLNEHWMYWEDIRRVLQEK